MKSVKVKSSVNSAVVENSENRKYNLAGKRFSCFNTHVHSHKQKKTVHLTSEAMHKILEDCSQSQSLKNCNHTQAITSSNLKLKGDAVENLTDHAADSSVGCDWISEDTGKNVIDCEVSVSKSVHHMKKSQSLGSGLDIKGRDSGENASEDEIEQQSSGDGSHDNTGSHGPNGAKGSGTSTPHQFQEALSSDACQINADVVNHEFSCSIGNVQQSEKEGHEKSDSHLSGPGESASLTPSTPCAIVKSNSLPNIRSPGHLYLLHRSRSGEGLSVLDSRHEQMLTLEAKTQELQHRSRNDEEWNINDKNNFENPVDESYDTYDCIGSSKDWIVPVADEANEQGNFHRYSSSCHWDELPSKDFKIKRIEDWVIDLQHCSPLEESNEMMSEGHDSPKSSNVLDVPPAVRMEGKVNKPGMDAVKKYLSSLSTTSTAAQLVNHGLVVIPFLSAFSSLRALNLSGNAIVRITAGALPRGLHILNLSKNNISTIEGLRELTRLRVLDLSYNRLLRIGHGLASCSSLKELYLAGNKISEVEGLHRLLKMNVLDLRFNKISTTKCLGQLAANYVSLQAISLEGNPAQKNVGDEQLKKYLQGLLPHLAYFNRQPIKTGTLKDIAERSARLGMNAHQIDRGLKPELKAMRKAAHSNASQKLPSSSNHGRRGQVTTTSKPSKSRHVRLPPNGTKVATQQSQFYDFNSKLLSFRSELSMRRSRSEGTLGVF